MNSVQFRVHAPGDTPDMTKPQHEAPTGFTTNVAVRMHRVCFQSFAYFLARFNIMQPSTNLYWILRSLLLHWTIGHIKY